MAMNSNGVRGDRRAARAGQRGATQAGKNLSIKERVGALGNVPPLFRLVWETSPPLLTASLVLRLVRAVLPVSMLYVGKLIVDEVVRLAGASLVLDGLGAWGGALSTLGVLITIEFGLAILSELLARATALADSLLGDLFTNETSVRLMRHAAALDLAHFEDADFYDHP